jgi:peroxiredoxin Q/BCP
MTMTFAVAIGSFLLVAIGTATADDGAAPAVRKDDALTVGQALPAFETTDDQGQPWKSADHVGKKVLVLYFYLGDFTGGCTRQAQAYRDGLAKIEN